ncbi:heparinase II/III family protein [Zunongwangia sp. F260]|uniref:Heparinase II/III family protein n=1 Tax=Autumnicola lenta TaxID=3075593 RepID=A0ABU3CNT4_9FLAO|nr:heparinase II/III family protein [Zunongwangia sp. F260]MDT0648014.1 heparinase II/III family protein [Zunongwangia sp. F260]
MYKIKISAGIIFFFILNVCVAQKVNISGNSVSTSHPRLFISEDFKEQVKRKIENDSSLNFLHDQILTASDSMLLLEPLSREMTGRRLLSVSRKALKRCLYLAYAYQTTGEEQYLKRAEEEMLAISAFSDWNPSHFLDVAEMTAGMAIGYDWLYNGLSKSSRDTIKAAIIAKGIAPSFEPEYNDWLKVENNWNQVCNTGITMGALSILEDKPGLAEEVLERTVRSIEIPLEVYKPDGVYPEGPMYWGYGTSFNVMLYDLLLSVFGKDFGIVQDEFLQSVYYFMHATAPSGDYFNYSDSNTSRSIGTVQYWFANYLEDPGILKDERKFLEKYIQNSNVVSPTSSSQRLLPFAVIWAGSAEGAAISYQNSFFGKSEVPVAMYRSSWDDPDALYIGIKGGSPSANHGHMDVGSFVFEMNGVRWAYDLGSESYSSLEAAGLDIWKSHQESDRWKVFRYNNRSHNTLTIDGKDQNVKGHAEIENLHGELMAASMDLTELYKESIEFAERKFEVIDKDQIKITDSISNNSEGSTVRWSMLTKADPQISEDGILTLRQDNEEIELQILSPGRLNWQVFMRDPRPAEHDSPNPGMKVVGFEYRLQPQEQHNVTVLIKGK